MVKKLLWAVLLIILFLGSFVAVRLIKEKYFNGITQTNRRTNFLLMGVNGSDSAGGSLTDTMIFLSLNKETGKAILISLPRDIWINEIRAKINTAYHYGGISLAKKTVGDIMGENIDYVLVLNFDGFEKAVDLVGGIMVDVQASFDDYLYPIPGKEKDLCGGDPKFSCRYEHLHFDAGRQLMDGKTALKYVRSRNAQGDEGTDFARALRQQRFLEGFKAKLMSPEVYLHPNRVYNLVKIFQEYSNTDIQVSQYGTFLQLAAKINWNIIKMTAINGNLLINPKSHYSRQWVLIPKSGDWKEVQAFVKNLLD